MSDLYKKILGPAQVPGSGAVPDAVWGEQKKLKPMPLLEGFGGATVVQAAPSAQYTIEESVTLQTNENIYDSSAVLPNGVFFIGTNTTPFRLLRWASYLDLATYSVLTFPADNSHNGNAQPNITYDAVGGFLYCAFAYEDGSDHEHIVIDKIDVTVSPPTRTQLVDFTMGTDAIAHSAVSLTNDGTHLYFITKTSLENCWIGKVKISDGTRPVSPVQLTGSNHIRGHAIGYDSITSKIYFSGTKIAAPKLAWTGWANLDLSSPTLLDISTSKGLSDDITFVGDSYLLNYENEDSKIGGFVKVKKDLSSTVDRTSGLAFDADGGAYDGVGYWYTVGSTPVTVCKIDPATGTLLASFNLQAGQTIANETLLFNSNTYMVVTCSTTPGKILRVKLT